MKHFVQSNLMEGYILQVRHLQFGFGRLIQRTLKCWAGHDALVVRDNGVLGIGDTLPFRARVTPLVNYEWMVYAGEIEIRVLAPADYDHYDGLCASAWWVQHEDGLWYDFISYPRLILKAIFGDDFQWSRDMKWDWCTEGCMDAWLEGAKKDYWRRPGYIGKIQPTPRTTQNRMNEGVFKDVTASCFAEEVRDAK